MTSSAPTTSDPKAGLVRALAETHLECLGAEHDYRRLLSEGADHMTSRYPIDTLDQQPEQLDHWAWHQQAMADAIEKGGLGEVPSLPYEPMRSDQTRGSRSEQSSTNEQDSMRPSDNVTEHVTK